MSKKSYADKCLRHAEAADIPELARRLKKACEKLREVAQYMPGYTTYPKEVCDLANELEDMPIKEEA